MISCLTFPKESEPEMTTSPAPGRPEWAPRIGNNLDSRRTPPRSAGPRAGVKLRQMTFIRGQTGRARNEPKTTTKLAPRIK